MTCKRSAAVPVVPMHTMLISQLMMMRAHMNANTYAAAQVEVDDYRDYEKALGALGESVKYATMSQTPQGARSAAAWPPLVLAALDARAGGVRSWRRGSNR